MPTLLNLEVSPRSDLSISRDLNASRIPYMHNDWIAGVRAPEVKRTPEMRQALALSAELIAELQAADVLLISTPM